MEKSDKKVNIQNIAESDLTSEKELETFNKELNKRILRDLFPVLSSMPLPWIIVSIVAFLFLLFMMIL